MRGLINFERIFVAALRNFIRNAWLSTAATAVMFVTLTIMLSGIMMTMALNKTIDQVREKIDVSVFLRDEITEQTRQALKQEFAQLENVTNVNYVSKQEALNRYREQNRNSPELLEAVSPEENPLPASFEVKVKDLNNIQPIVDITQKDDYKAVVDSTSYDEDRQKTIQRIAGASRFITQASIVASSAFAIISILIIFNTIRMALFTRRDEIQIMQLIGATKNFIRGPFLVEAAIYGIVAGLLALGTAYSGLMSLAPKVSTHINFEPVIALFGTNWLLVAFGMLASGILIGVFSSSLALVRYLKL